MHAAELVEVPEVHDLVEVEHEVGVLGAGDGEAFREVYGAVDEATEDCFRVGVFRGEAGEELDLILDGYHAAELVDGPDDGLKFLVDPHLTLVCVVDGILGKFQSLGRVVWTIPWLLRFLGSVAADEAELVNQLGGLASPVVKDALELGLVEGEDHCSHVAGGDGLLELDGPVLAILS